MSPSLLAKSEPMLESFCVFDRRTPLTHSVTDTSIFFHSTCSETILQMCMLTPVPASSSSFLLCRLLLVRLLPLQFYLLSLNLDPASSSSVLPTFVETKSLPLVVHSSDFTPYAHSGPSPLQVVMVMVLPVPVHRQLRLSALILMARKCIV